MWQRYKYICEIKNTLDIVQIICVDIHNTQMHVHVKFEVLTQIIEK